MQAMILAAGFGKRMLPLTNSIPKPLVLIKKKPILFHIINKLLLQNISEITINTHHLSDKLISCLNENFNNNFQVIVEQEILDTGGGVANAILKKKIGKDNNPFFIINGDIFWMESVNSVFSSLIAGWDDEKMDILLMLIEKNTFFGYKGLGDFNFVSIKNNLGMLTNDSSIIEKKYVYSGVQLIHPRIFEGIKKKKFSLKEVFDDALKKKSLFGLIDYNEWFHIGTVEDLDKAQKIL